MKGEPMNFANKIAAGAGAAGLALFAALPAWAQDAAAAAPAPVVDKGDTAWMMTSTVLVLAMILPGLALFYGGLTRTKNMLSTMTQIGALACLAMIVWVVYGYSFAFGGLNAVFASGLRQYVGGNHCVPFGVSPWGVPSTDSA